MKSKIQKVVIYFSYLQFFTITANVCATQQVGLYLYCWVGLPFPFGAGTQLYEYMLLFSGAYSSCFGFHFKSNIISIKTRWVFCTNVSQTQNGVSAPDTSTKKQKRKLLSGTEARPTEKWHLCPGQKQGQWESGASVRDRSMNCT